MDCSGCNGSYQCHGGCVPCLWQWTQPHLRLSNTFLELAPPLVDTYLGFRAWRRQISEPTASGSGIDAALQTPPQIQRLEKKLLAGKCLDDCGASEERRTRMAAGGGGCFNDAAARAVGNSAEAPSVVQDGKSLHGSLLDGSGGSEVVVVQGTRPESVEFDPHFQPPNAATSALPSVGSKLHSKRRCRPCAFVQSDAGCRDGAACRFCHFPHSNTERMWIRPSKSKRDRYNKFIDKLFHDISTNPDSVDLEQLTLPRFVEQSPSRKGRLLAQLSRYAAEDRHHLLVSQS